MKILFYQMIFLFILLIGQQPVYSFFDTNKDPNPNLVSHETTNNNENYIHLTALSDSVFCFGSSVTAYFTTNLPIGTEFTINLYKGSEIIQTNSSSFSNSYIRIDAWSLIINEYDSYYITISGGGTESNVSDTIQFYKHYRSKLKWKEISINEGNRMSICEGSTLTLKARALDMFNYLVDKDLNYKWFLNDTLINNNKTDSLIIYEPGRYRLSITQKDCTPNSVSFYISRDSIPESNMGGGVQYSCEGEPIQLTSILYSNESTFQWKKNGEIIPGETKSTLNTNISASYSIITNDLNCKYPTVESESVYNYFSPYLLPKISVLHNDSTLCGDYPVYLNNETEFYQWKITSFTWQKDGDDYLEDDEFTRALVVTEPGKYRIKMTWGSCTSYSKEVNIVKSNKLQKPNIFTDYDSLCSGAIFLRSGDKDENGIFSFQSLGLWFKDDSLLVSFNTNNFTAEKSGIYKLIRGYGTDCEISSDEKVISIGENNLSKPNIAYKLGTSTNICTENIYNSLSYDDFSAYPLFSSFKWKKDGEYVSDFSGRYGFPANSPGSYQLEIDNNGCIEISEPLIITKSSLVTPKINYTDLSFHCNSNRLIKLSASEITMGTAPYYGYSWYHNDIKIPFIENNFTYTDQPGDYYFIFNKDGCYGQSETIIIKSGPNNDFLIEKPSASYKNESAKISIQSCGGDVKWYENETTFDPFFIGKTYSTPALINNVSYWVSCTEEYCESDRVQVNIVVENCTEKIIHNGVVEDRIYKASQSIESSSNLPSGAIYDAGKSIILLPGFSAGSNEVFEARIGGCE